VSNSHKRRKTFCFGEEVDLFSCGTSLGSDIDTHLYIFFLCSKHRPAKDAFMGNASNVQSDIEEPLKSVVYK